MKPNKIKKYFFIFLAAQLFLAHVNLAYAQSAENDYTKSGVQAQIEAYLCAPSAPPATTDNTGSAISIGSSGAQMVEQAKVSGNNDLFTCINKLYRFAIAVGSVVGIFFIVISGYLWMSAGGNQESVDKAKSIFESTIVSMVILFAGFILLKALNPDLLKFQSIQPPNIVAPAGIPGSGAGSGVPGAKCTPVPSGPASVASLQQTCFGSNATKASSIANVESGGNPTIGSGTDKCIEDGTSVSWGLFQINISSNTINGLPCPDAFDKTLNPRGYTGSNHHCRVINQQLFNQCKQAAITESTAIQKACQISNNGTTWSQWGANKVCNY